MKLNDKIKYAYLMVKRNKKNKYFIVILVICIIILLSGLYYKTYYDKVNAKHSKESVLYRNILISPTEEELSKHYEDKNYDYGYDKILQIDHVLEIYNLKYGYSAVFSPTFKNDIHNGHFEVMYGSEYSIPDNIVGQKIKSYDTGVAICPTNFFPSNDLENIDYKQKNILLKGNDILNKSFDIEKDIYQIIDNKMTYTGTYKKKFKIIGLYDPAVNGEAVYDCYISSNDIKELYDTTFSAIEGYGLVTYAVTVDKYENVDYVMKEIVKLGFDVETQVTTDISYQNKINLISLLTTLLTIISIVILTVLFVKKKNINNAYITGIMKSMGYKNKDIKREQIIEMLIISLKSIVIGILVFEIVYFIIKISFSNYLIIKNITLSHYLKPYLIMFLVILIIPALTNYIFTSKKLKLKTITIIKGEKE